MDYQALKALIIANNLQALTDAEIVTALNAVAGTRHVERKLNSIGLMSALGNAKVAADIVEKLIGASAGDSVLRVIMPFMGTDMGVNFGDPVTLANFDLLVIAGVLTATERDLLKGLSEVPSSLALTALGESVNEEQVSIAQRVI